MANKVAESLTDNDDFIVSDEDPAENLSLSADEVIGEFLRDTGYLYFLKGEYFPREVHDRKTALWDCRSQRSLDFL